LTSGQLPVAGHLRHVAPPPIHSIGPVREQRGAEVVDHWELAWRGVLEK
jgi:hypothetical protein